MGRLIDEDSVIQVLKETGIIQDNDLGHLVVDEINRIPTAYDIEKVVAELEEAYPINPYPNEFTNGRDLAIKKAIEIVRKGGVE